MSTVKIDGTGRIVVPKSVRDYLNLSSGTVLECAVENNRIVLSPRTRREPLVEVDGLLVHTGEPREDISGFLTRHREERIRSLGHIG